MNISMLIDRIISKKDFEINNENNTKACQVSKKISSRYDEMASHYIIFTLLIALESKDIVSNLIERNECSIEDLKLNTDERDKLSMICKWLESHQVVQLKGNNIMLTNKGKDILSPAMLSMFYLICNYQSDLHELTYFNKSEIKKNGFESTVYSDLAASISIRLSLEKLLSLIKQDYQKNNVFNLFAPDYIANDCVEGNTYNFADSKNCIWLDQAKELTGNIIIIISLIFHEMDNREGDSCIDFLKKIKTELPYAVLVLSEVTNDFISDKAEYQFIVDNVVNFSYIHSIAKAGRIRSVDEWVQIIASSGFLMKNHIKLPQSPHISTFIAE